MNTTKLAAYMSPYQRLTLRELLLTVLNSPGGGSFDGAAFEDAVHIQLVEAAGVISGLTVKLQTFQGPGRLSRRQEASGSYWREVGHLNRIFTKCRLQPFVEINADGTSLSEDSQIQGGLEDASVEGYALLGLAHLVQDGSAHLLKKCSCGKWYVASRAGQKACETACYRRQYQNSEEFKDKRRRYYKDVIVGGKAVIREHRKGSAHAKASK